VCEILKDHAVDGIVSCCGELPHLKHEGHWLQPVLLQLLETYCR